MVLPSMVYAEALPLPFESVKPTVPSSEVLSEEQASKNEIPKSAKATVGHTLVKNSLRLFD